MPDGKMTPEFYNSLGAMHGTIMIFLGIVPLAFAAFGNFVVPLQIGAPDMTFPKINMASYWAFFVGGVIMLMSFFVPGGAAKGGWTSYTPLAVIADNGPDLRHRFSTAKPLADRVHSPDHLVTAGRGEFHRHDHSTPRQRDDLDAAAVLRLGAICDGVPAPARLPAAGIRDRDATDGSGRGHELFPAERPGRQRRAAAASAAAAVRCSGSISFGSSGIRKFTC